MDGVDRRSITRANPPDLRFIWFWMPKHNLSLHGMPTTPVPRCCGVCQFTVTHVHVAMSGHILRAFPAAQTACTTCRPQLNSHCSYRERVKPGMHANGRRRNWELAVCSAAPFASPCLNPLCFLVYWKESSRAVARAWPVLIQRRRGVSTSQGMKTLPFWSPLSLPLSLS